MDNVIAKKMSPREKAMAWALTQDVRIAHAKLVLVVLAYHSDKDFQCSRSVRIIATDCNSAQNTIRKYIDHLLCLGLLSLHPPQYGSFGERLPNTYRLNIRDRLE